VSHVANRILLVVCRYDRGQVCTRPSALPAPSATPVSQTRSKMGLTGPLQILSWHSLQNALKFVSTAPADDQSRCKIGSDWARAGMSVVRTARSHKVCLYYAHHLSKLTRSWFNRASADMTMVIFLHAGIIIAMGCSI
jgi:hypothetical protein